MKVIQKVNAQTNCSIFYYAIKRQQGRFACYVTIVNRKIIVKFKQKLLQNSLNDALQLRVHIVVGFLFDF